MKNLKLRMKLCCLGVIFILFAAFGIFFLHQSMEQMQEKTIELIGQEHQTPDGESSIEEPELRQALTVVASEQTKVFGMVSIACAVLILLFLIWIYGGMAKIFRQTETALKKLAKGDFSETPGEEAAGIMEETRKNLGSLYGEVKHAANGLTRSVLGAGSLGTKVGSEIAGIAGNLEQIMASMKETSVVLEEVSGLSAEMEASIQGIASRAEDSLGWVRDIRERAEAARESAEEKQEIVRKNKKDMKEGLTRELKDAGLAGPITALSESVMKTLEKVNLLSLNASVEAAKAGIAGKEYAIVTDEIRILTEESMKAVENIQWAAEEVVSAVHNLDGSTMRLMEFLDTEIYSACKEFVKMAESYIRDAGELDFISSSFHTEAEELSANLDRLQKSMGQICGRMESKEANLSKAADQMARLDASTAGMMRDIRKAEHTARLLNKGMGQFHITEKESQD